MKRTSQGTRANPQPKKAKKPPPSSRPPSEQPSCQRTSKKAVAAKPKEAQPPKRPLKKPKVDPKQSLLKFATKADRDAEEFREKAWNPEPFDEAALNQRAQHKGTLVAPVFTQRVAEDESRDLREKEDDAEVPVTGTKQQAADGRSFLQSMKDWAL